MPSIEEDRITALIDALKRNPRITRADLGPLIRQEFDPHDSIVAPKGRRSVRVGGLQFGHGVAGVIKHANVINSDP